MISGDTAPTQALIDHSRGCDVLVHEAYSMMAYRNGVRRRPRNTAAGITRRRSNWRRSRTR